MGMLPTCMVSYFIANIKSIYRPGVSSRNMKRETRLKKIRQSIFPLKNCMRSINLIVNDAGQVFQEKNMLELIRCMNNAALYKSMKH